MPSKNIYSPGPSAVSSPGSTTAGTPGEFDPLHALVTQSERAVDLLLAADCDPARQAALAAMAADSDRAAQRLLAAASTTPPASGRPAASRPGDIDHMKASVPAGIHSSDLVRLLQAEGFKNARPWTLRYAARRQRIPEPFRTASGDHAWKPADLPVIRRYLKNPVGPGRPRKSS